MEPEARGMGLNSGGAQNLGTVKGGSHCSAFAVTSNRVLHCLVVNWSQTQWQRLSIKKFVMIRGGFIRGQKTHRPPLRRTTFFLIVGFRFASFRDTLWQGYPTPAGIWLQVIRRSTYPPGRCQGRSRPSRPHSRPTGSAPQCTADVGAGLFCHRWGETQHHTMDCIMGSGRTDSNFKPPVFTRHSLI